PIPIFSRVQGRAQTTSPWESCCRRWIFSWHLARAHRQNTNSGTVPSVPGFAIRLVTGESYHAAVLRVLETFRNKTKARVCFSILRRLTSNAPATNSQERNAASPRHSIEFANPAQQFLESSNTPFSLDFAPCFP